MKTTVPKSKAAVGALVRFCGHRGVFSADIIRVGNVVVVRGGGPVSGSTIMRAPQLFEQAKFHLSDCPGPVYWDERRGIFVVPHENLTVVTP